MVASPSGRRFAEERQKATGEVAFVRECAAGRDFHPVSLRTDSLAIRRTNPDKYYLVDTGMTMDVSRSRSAASAAM